MDLAPVTSDVIPNPTHNEEQNQYGNHSGQTNKPTKAKQMPQENAVVQRTDLLSEVRQALSNPGQNNKPFRIMNAAIRKKIRFRFTSTGTQTS
jgi:hypothetical protein